MAWTLLVQLQREREDGLGTQGCYPVRFLLLLHDPSLFNNDIAFLEFFLFRICCLLLLVTTNDSGCFELFRVCTLEDTCVDLDVGARWASVGRNERSRSSLLGGSDFLWSTGDAKGLR